MAATRTRRTGGATDNIVLMCAIGMLGRGRTDVPTVGGEPG